MADEADKSSEEASGGPVRARRMMPWLGWSAYLGVVGLAYQVAYWSQFGINILEYTSLQGVVPLAVMPVFLSLKPWMLVIAGMILWEKIPASVLGFVPESIDRGLEILLPQKLRPVLVGLVAVGVFVGAVYAFNWLVLRLVLGVTLGEAGAWLILAVITFFSGFAAGLRRHHEVDGRRAAWPNGPPMVWGALAALPLISYSAGLSAASIVQDPDLRRRSDAAGMFDHPAVRCVASSGRAIEPAVRFVGHVDEFDFLFNVYTGVLMRRSSSDGALSLAPCTGVPVVNRGTVGTGR